ncbi:hydroxyethylthiazole kinase [Aliibacillus thermotolerans]|uniref:Hydroxyethylthiazole kinase n=1 Tax=Aliibacillus thermotolerans TaxID=1834418 RepID=A0ABW0UAF9_9BACI|nr:hydroxyethylthiazole kinase [Aliibacillus thermotolerans]MDA3129561.1 hydroxyethylthiazole kinase [Aliibacillus thermotolerans]
MIEKVREKRPLIYHITNTVVTNFTANGLLAMGASPVMADAEEEAAEMAAAADALVLNIGTLHPSQVKAMFVAGRAANKKGIPIVLDPVGAGATSYRTETARQLLKELNISLLRGNVGEIKALIGSDGNIQGVDAIQTEVDEMEAVAKEAASLFSVPVVVSGAVDIVTDEKDLYRVANGDELLIRITGSGCLLSGVIASFLTVNDSRTEAAADALTYYGVAAEKAAMKGEQPGSFQVAFLDALYEVGKEEIQKMAKQEKMTLS